MQWCVKSEIGEFSASFGGDMPRGAFDVPRFYAALDGQRVAKGLSWKEVGEQAGVSPSMLTRIGQGKRPDVDGLALLLAWSGLDAALFLPSAGAPEPLAQVSAYLRADKNLSRRSVEALDEIIRVAYSGFKSAESVDG